jgi:hypothetical protein
LRKILYLEFLKKMEKEISPSTYGLAELNYQYFFLNTSRQQAEAILSSLGENSFLIRPSTTIEQCFVITKYIVKTRKFLHLVIESQHNDKGEVSYQLRDCASDRTTYNTLDDLVKNCPELKGYKPAGTIWFHLSPGEKQMILDKANVSGPVPTSPNAKPAQPATSEMKVKVDVDGAEQKYEPKEKDKEKNNSHQGYMTKRGGFVKNWKRRWFVLCDGLMFYYKMKPELAHTYGASSKPCGHFSVKGCYCGPAMSLKQSIKAEHLKNCIQIETPNRIYFMYPDSYEQVEEWKESLMRNGAIWDIFRYRKSFIAQDGTVFKLNETGTEYVPMPEKPQTTTTTT